MAQIKIKHEDNQATIKYFNLPQVKQEQQAQAATVQKLQTELKNGVKKRKYIKKKDRIFKCSLWSVEENMRYMRFLKQYGHYLEHTKRERKIMKINILMSNIVMTRSAQQCRSHHQKMIKFHHTIQNIITHIQKLHRNQQETRKEEKKIRLQAYKQMIENKGIRQKSNQNLVKNQEYDVIPFGFPFPKPSQEMPLLQFQYPFHYFCNPYFYH